MNFRPLRFLLLVVLIGCSTTPHLRAQQQTPEPLTVVTRKVTPFVMERNGRLTGYSIELWERVVREARLPFDPDSGYRTVDTVQQMLDELRAGRADAAVAALSITSERERTVDFSYPFKESGLQILAKEQQTGSFSRIVGSLIKGKILWLLGGLLFVLLLNSHIIWLLERRKNPESFPEGYLAGLWEAVWWSVCTIITGGCENKAPLGVAGRLTAIVWMLAGAALFTYITATITSAMTVETLTSDVQSVADLKSRRWAVGTVAGSTAESFLLRQGLSVQGFASVDSAAEALMENRVRAVVYDAPMLLYYAKNNPERDLAVVGELFEKQSYGIGVPHGSPYRKEITRAILALREQGFIDELENRYFGTSTGASTTAATQ
jgi:polar amino acid transport system substrate-binding protein